MPFSHVSHSNSNRTASISISTFTIVNNDNNAAHFDTNDLAN